MPSLMFVAYAVVAFAVARWGNQGLMYGMMLLAFMIAGWYFDELLSRIKTMDERLSGANDNGELLNRIDALDERLSDLDERLSDVIDELRKIQKMNGPRSFL